MDLSKKTVPELRRMAKRLGIQLPSGYTPKASLMRRIQRKKLATSKSKPKKSTAGKSKRKPSAAKKASLRRNFMRMRGGKRRAPTKNETRYYALVDKAYTFEDKAGSLMYKADVLREKGSTSKTIENQIMRLEDRAAHYYSKAWDLKKRAEAIKH